MVYIPQPILCTPETLRPYISCLVCGRSKHELLAAFDALLCSQLNRPDCSASALLELSKPYLGYSAREITEMTTYLWFTFLTTASPETDTSQEAMAQAVSPFLMSSEIEILAMQLWILCQLGGVPAECDADTLINNGRCYCIPIKELLAIRACLLGLFVGNFAPVDTSPAALLAAAHSFYAFSAATLEASFVWAMCQIYDAALESQPT